MRHTMWFLALALVSLACSAAVSEADSDKKGEEVVLDDLKAAVPAEWKKEEPKGTMRFAQFKLPRVKDDKMDAELVIFKGLGGSTKANIDRWKSQFIPPEGKKIEDVAKVAEIKIGGKEATLLDVSGTFKYKARPMDPSSKEELMPDFRMLAIQFEGPKEVYHIKLTGPAKTIDKHKKGFDEWIKAFK